LPAARANEPEAEKPAALPDLHIGEGELASVTTDAVVAPNDGAVEPRSGQLYLGTTDLIVPAGAIQLEVHRNYCPQPLKTRGLLGRRWRLNWESRLTHAGPMAAIEEGFGTTVFLQDSTTGKYRSGGGEELVLSFGGAVRTKVDGTKERFDAAGRLIERDHRRRCRGQFRQGLCLFLQGNQFLQYDLAADHVVEGFPMPLDDKHWPGWPMKSKSVR
jgi:hypothetical protein